MPATGYSLVVLFLYNTHLISVTSFVLDMINDKNQYLRFLLFLCHSHSINSELQIRSNIFKLYPKCMHMHGLYLKKYSTLNKKQINLDCLWTEFIKIIPTFFCAYLYIFYEAFRKFIYAYCTFDRPCSTLRNQ